MIGLAKQQKSGFGYVIHAVPLGITESPERGQLVLSTQLMVWNGNWWEIVQ